MILASLSTASRFSSSGTRKPLTVCSAAPGFVRTEMTQRGRGAADWPGTEASFAARAMMGRIGEPEDVAFEEMRKVELLGERDQIRELPLAHSARGDLPRS